jgi:hypothetical protein
MDIDEHWSASVAGAVEIELLSFGRAIGDTLRRADAHPNRLARAGEALGDLVISGS